MALASCGTLCPNPNEVDQLGKDAVEAIQKPDAYYLKKCDPLPVMESESIEHIIEAVTKTVEQYRDICRRHDGLVEQVK